jgi:hypothetical protein
MTGQYSLLVLPVMAVAKRVTLRTDLGGGGGGGAAAIVVLW